MAHRTAPATAIRLLTVCILAAAVVGALAWRTGRAEAHARLIRAYPADGAVLESPPAQIDLLFSEEVDARFSAIHVTDADEQPVLLTGSFVDPLSRSRLIAGLPQMEHGLYRVEWRAWSATDAHLASGTIVFRLGPGPVRSAPQQDTAGVSAVEVALAWVNIAAFSLLAGSIVVRTTVLAHPRLRAARSRSGRLAASAAVVALLAGAGTLVQHAAIASDRSLVTAMTDGAWWTILRETRWGMLWLAQEAALLCALMLVLVTMRRRPALGLLIWPLLVVFALAHAQAGHSASGSTLAFAVIASGVHLLSGGMWLGGLVAMFLSLRRAHVTDAHTMFVPQAWRRFTMVAGPCALVALATGLYGAGQQVADASAFVDSPYGRILVAKSAVVLVAVGVGGINFAILHGPRGGLLHRVGFARVVAIECLAGAVVLGAAGLLAATPPALELSSAESSAHTSGFASQKASDLLVTLSLRPNEPGDNFVDVTILDSRRPAPAPITDVALEFLSPAGSETQVLRLARGPSGTYSLKDATLAGGPSQFRVIVNREGMPAASALFDMQVGAGPPLLVPAGRSLEVLLTRAALLLLLGGVIAGGVGTTISLGPILRRRVALSWPRAGDPT